MIGPFIVGIWAATLREGVKLVDDLYLGDNVVQFSPDLDCRGAVWIILRVTGDQKAALRERGQRATPRWSFL